MVKKKVVAKVKKCPSDADVIHYLNYDCPAKKMFEGMEWSCTRQREHGGKHHAHGFSGTCHLVWGDD